VSSRDAGKLETLSAWLGDLASDRLVRVSADVGDRDGAESIKAVITERFDGRLDHVVSSSGPWYKHAPTYEMPLDEFYKIQRSNFDAHFVIWHTFAPLLVDRPGSSYTVVTGMAGNAPGKSGLTGVFAASLFALSDLFISETASKPVRVNELRISVRVENDANYERLGKPSFAMSSSEFGAVFPALARSTLKGKVVPLPKDRFASLLQELA
jgi:NAD(P)-dependent dehydrogenase (short-subunit alcohol dehydrogenase family)